MSRVLLAFFGCLAVLAAHGQQAAVERPDFSGVYRPAGLAVQPCGYNEWLRRSFETDKFCLGSDDGFPFSDEGLAAWRAYSPINDPILRCIETFPRTAMRGRPLRVTLGKETTEIAYWFSNRWHRRTVHMNGSPAPANTEDSDFGYSTGHWVGDSLIVETTHTKGGPMFNDHKQSSAEASFTERFWIAPDGQNLLMDIAMDDARYYTKPFLVNRQEWISAPERPLSETQCTPSSIWSELQENDD